MKKEEKEFLDFTTSVLELNPIELVGLARILNISIKEKPSEEDITSQILDKWIDGSSKYRNNLRKILGEEVRK